MECFVVIWLPSSNQLAVVLQCRASSSSLVVGVYKLDGWRWLVEENIQLRSGRSGQRFAASDKFASDSLQIQLDLIADPLLSEYCSEAFVAVVQ